MRTFRALLPALLLAALPAFGDPASAPAAGAPSVTPSQPSDAKPAPAKAISAAKKAPVSAAAAAVAAAAAAESAPVNPRFKQIRDRISYLFHTDVALTPVTSSKSNPFRLPGDSATSKKTAASGAKGGAAGEDGSGDAADAAGGTAGDDGSLPGGPGGKKHVRGKEVDPDDPDAYGDDDSGAKKKAAEELEDEIPSKPGARIMGTASSPAAKSLRHAIVSLKIEGISVLNGVPRISIGGLLHREGDFVRQPGRGHPVWLQILKITPTSVMFGLRDGGDTGPHLTVQM